MSEEWYFAVDFVMDCYGTAVMWFGILINRLGALNAIISLFAIAMAVLMLIKPLRGDGFYSNGELGGTIFAGSASTRNYSNRGLPAGSSDSARRKKK